MSFDTVCLQLENGFLGSAGVGGDDLQPHVVLLVELGPLLPHGGEELAEGQGGLKQPSERQLVGAHRRVGGHVRAGRGGAGVEFPATCMTQYV